MRDCMIDIETIGRPPDGGIIAIGAVMFDRESTGIDVSKAFVRTISPIDAAQHGTVDMATIMWWMKQDPVVRNEMFAGNASLKSVLRNLQEWYKGADYIWANGTTFDITILEHAFKAVNVKSPWHYRDVRDMRFCRDVLPKNIMETYYNAPGAHNVLRDAVVQANVVQRTFDWLANPA